ARVLIANTDLVQPDEVHGTLDLLAERWAGKAGIALPLTGTTLTHATALYQVMGEAWARDFFGKIAAANAEGLVNLPNSNGQSMTLTKAGELAWAFTDTDDYYVAEQDGAPVARIYPDQVEAPGTLMKDGAPIGTLLIPNTIMLFKDAPHAENAKRFIDWVLRPEVEARLAASRSAQIPVRERVARPAHVGRLGDFKAM
ncbi:MAG: extracellular solute-binding protein, partial [Planctomycetes bacterium]|nr:extracellular solute-binding protein [Planctomycetota bacterium]